jgi:hypothetical protein
MKKFTLPAVLVTALTVLLLTSCSVSSYDTQAPAELQGYVNDASASPVELLWVKATSTGSLKARAYGFIEVENIAYEKNVVVAYWNSETDSWQETSASYVEPTFGNYEKWYFETPEISENTPYSMWGVSFQLAVRYEVNGQTYWDNNDGQDYLVSYNASPMPSAPSTAIGRVNILQQWGRLERINNLNNNVSGRLLVKDLAVDKKIDMVWTIDNWETHNRTLCNYIDESSYDNAVEEWSFAFGYMNLPLDAVIEYCFVYEVNGETYWDNNSGQNYQLQ